MPATLDHLTDKEQEALKLIRSRITPHEPLEELLPNIHDNITDRLGINLINWIVLRIIGTHCLGKSISTIDQKDLFNELRDVDYDNSVSVTNAVCELTVPLIKVGLIKGSEPHLCPAGYSLTPRGHATLLCGIKILNNPKLPDGKRLLQGNLLDMAKKVYQVIVSCNRSIPKSAILGFITHRDPKNYPTPKSAWEEVVNPLVEMGLLDTEFTYLGQIMYHLTSLGTETLGLSHHGDKAYVSQKPYSTLTSWPNILDTCAKSMK